MTKWVPYTRHDGSTGRVNVETGEVATSIAEVLGLWRLDDALGGLLAELEEGGEAA